MKPHRAVVALLALTIGACVASEAFPTVVDNRSQHPIAVRYHHKDYPSWSAVWTIPPGEAQSFAREHWIQDIIAIQIQDGDRMIALASPEMKTIRNACANSLLTRRLKIAGDCYVVYLGDGRWTATAQMPSGISNRLNKSLQ